jgi:hypothetical protein
MPRTKAGAKQKGKTGEREVAALWRSYGWEKACPTPGSGALRPWGAGDIPAWPGDIAFIGSWCCEVKRTEKMNAATGRANTKGWDGEAFIRATIREHSKLVDRLNTSVGGKRWRSVVVGRASFQPWRWFIPETAFRVYQGALPMARYDGYWVELSTDHFFEYALAVGPP